MVFQLLNSVAPEVKLIETVGFQVAKQKRERFLELMDGLIADTSRSSGVMAFNFHERLPASEHHIEYLLYEVWRDRDALRKQWESDFLRVFQGRLISESLLAGPPELKFFVHERTG